MREDFPSPTGFPVDQHRASRHTGVIRPLLILVHRHPHHPIKLAVGDVLLVGGKFDSPFHGTLGVDEAQVDLGFIPVDQYGGKIAQVERAGHISPMGGEIAGTRDDVETLFSRFHACVPPVFLFYLTTRGGAKPGGSPPPPAFPCLLRTAPEAPLRRTRPAGGFLHPFPPPGGWRPDKRGTAGSEDGC